MEIAAIYIISSFVWNKEERKYLPTNFMKPHYPGTNSDNCNGEKLQARMAQFDICKKVSKIIQSNPEMYEENNLP